MAEDTATDSMTLAESVGLSAGAGTELPKLPQTVDISDAGPCKKHVKVTIDRPAIDAKLDEKYTELTLKSPIQLPGFRAGKAPRKLIERKYAKEVISEVKTELLMQSLEQLAEEKNLSPLSPPELDPNSVTIPEDGPMVYEFRIEVRPEFDLPNYKNLTVKRPIYNFTDADVATEKKRILSRFGTLVPKEGENVSVAMGDTVTVDVVLTRGTQELNRVKEVQLKVRKRLALQDGVAEDFGKKLTGAKVGETRTVDIVLSNELNSSALRGAAVQASFTVLDIKTTRLPELTNELLTSFGLRNEEQFNELIRTRLERQLAYTQRNVAKQSVIETLAKDAKWDLPQDLLKRQARKTLERRVMEMRSAGIADDVILGRRRVMEQDAIRSTAAALSEHFVLQKIADLEKIEIEDDEIDAEIEQIAEQENETFRRVKARMEREGQLESLATELLERKALDLVLSTATFEDYEYNPMTPQDEDDIATADAELVQDEPAPQESTPESASDTASEAKK